MQCETNIITESEVYGWCHSHYWCKITLRRWMTKQYRNGVTWKI